MFGPTITYKGGKVTLRKPRPEEAKIMVTWLEDPEVNQYLSITHPLSDKQEEEWLEGQARDPNSIFWAVEFESRLVGVTSIERIDWANQHGTTGTVIGDKSVWRQGLGTELMQLRANYAFTQTTLRKLKSGYLADNIGSAKAQKNTGYKIVGVQRQEYFRNGRWIDHVVTEILREDWEKDQVPPGPNHHAELHGRLPGDLHRPFGHDEGEGSLRDIED